MMLAAITVTAIMKNIPCAVGQSFAVREPHSSLPIPNHMNTVSVRTAPLIIKAKFIAIKEIRGIKALLTPCFYKTVRSSNPLARAVRM